MSGSLLLNSFNAGEHSPLLRARTDLPKYHSGCKTMRNVIPRMFGGAFSRPGMVYKGEVNNSARRARLMDFDFSSDTRFVFEFQQNTLRFWSNGELVQIAATGTSWAGASPSYAAGTLVYRDGAVSGAADSYFYACKTTHTPTTTPTDNGPPGVNWNATNVRMWTAGAVYNAGDVIIVPASGGQVFFCTGTHTASYTGTFTYLARIGITIHWTATPAYWAVGKYVVHEAGGNRRYFRCKTPHTYTTGSMAPGGSAGYWEEVSTTPNHITTSRAYLKGDVVKVGTALYFANADHVSSTTNKPTDLMSPWVLINGVQAWTGLTAARAAGDLVYYAGEILACKVAYTTGAFITVALHASNWSAMAADGVDSPAASGATPAWTTSPEYIIGTTVTSGGLLYQCVISHNAATGKQPGTTGGADYWQLLSSATGGSQPLMLPTPYLEADLFDIQMCQVNDWVYLCHPKYPPYKLTRYADATWKLDLMPGIPPMRDQNITDLTLAVANTTKGASTTLTASSGFFTTAHLGSVFAISHYRDDAIVDLTYPASATPAVSGSVKITGNFELFSYGIWTGTLYLERSSDNGTTWDVYRNYVSRGDHNLIDDSGNDRDTYLYRLRYQNVGATTVTGGHCVLRAADAKATGSVKITAYTSPSVVTVTVLESPAKTTATKYWAKSAWDAIDGYPRAVTLHDQRLWFGGTVKQPRMVWGSVIGDFETFTRSTLDDSGLAYQVAGKSNSVQWLASQGSLLIGTQGDESVLDGSANSDTAITPTNVRAKIQSAYGSAYMPAVIVNDVVLFVEADGRTVREFVFAFEKNGYVAQRMTLLAEHVTQSGIIQCALQTKPDIVLWCVTADGRLIAMTYERAQEVVAWHQHTTPGLPDTGDLEGKDIVESVTVIGGEPGASDEIWLVVNRTINGTQKRYLERLDPFHWSKVEDGNLPYSINLDCAKVVESTGVVNGLEHLEGALVTCVLDGKTVEKLTVSGGSITPVAAHSVAVVGLPFTPYFEPNDLDVQMPDGTSFGRYQRTTRAQLVLWQTAAGVQVRHGPATQWSDVPLVDDPADAPPLFFTGRREVMMDGAHAREGGLAIRQSMPFPMNVLGLVVKTEFNGD